MSDVTDERWQRIVVEVVRRAMVRLSAKMSARNEDLLPDIQAVIAWLDGGFGEPPSTQAFGLLGMEYSRVPTAWGSYLSERCAMLMAADEAVVASADQARDNEYAQQKLDINELMNVVETL